MIIFTALCLLCENALNTGLPEAQQFSESLMLQSLHLLYRIYLHEHPRNGSSNLYLWVLFNIGAARSDQALIS